MTTKSVERTAEAIGEDIAAREQQQIQRAVQLDLPIIIGDGAEWIWNLAAQHFPGAIQIVDLYHARQHLWELARKLYPNDPRAQKKWVT
ncbi:MAG: hypothetical protein ACRD7E_10595, partial [Bryobacteraceae bacterium]